MAAFALADKNVPFAGELPSEFSPDTFAGACRRAYLQLLSGAARGWSKAELAAWLSGPYERLARALPEVGSQPPPSSNDVSPTRLRDLLDAARLDVLLVLQELTVPEGIAAFTAHAADTKLIMTSVDVDGEPAFVPRARPRMSLVDRALSLVAVDALVRPRDYTEQMFVCSRCDTPVFDAASRSLGMCALHKSGVSVKE